MAVSKKDLALAIRRQEAGSRIIIDQPSLG